MPIIKNEIGAEVRQRLEDIRDIKILSDNSDARSKEALEHSVEADERSQYQKERLDMLISEGEQPSEVVDMRKDVEGVEHVTAGERLKSDYLKSEESIARVNSNLEARGTSIQETDTITKIQSMVDSAVNSSGILRLPALDVLGSITIPGDKTLRIVGNGSKTKLRSDGGSIIKTTNTPVMTTSVTEAIVEGSHYIPFQTTSDIKVGQLITLSSTEKIPEKSFSWDKSHSALITEVQGTRVVIDRPIPYLFNVGNTITARIYNVGNISIENVSLIGSGIGQLIDIVNCSGFEAKNISFYGPENYDLTDVGLDGVRIMYSVDTSIKNPKFKNVRYGVLPSNGSVVAEMLNAKAYHCRHISAPSGTSQYFTAEDVQTYNCYAGIDSHQGARESVYKNVNTFNDQFISKLRGRKDVLRDANISGGLEIRNDDVLFTAGQSTKDQCDKILENVTSKKMIYGVVLSASLKKVRAEGSIMITAVGQTGERLFMDDVKANVFSDPYTNSITNKKIGLWLGYFKYFIAKNIEIIGPLSGSAQTSSSISEDYSAVLIDRDPLYVEELENVIIDGFPRGIEMTNQRNLDNFKMNNVLIRNCKIGLDPRTSYKDNAKLEKIRFEGCAMDINESFRFRNSKVTSDNSQLQPKIIFGTAPPTQGNFKSGDICINTNPSVGSYTGWRCLSGGNPGTWNPYGKIEA